MRRRSFTFPQLTPFSAVLVLVGLCCLFGSLPMWRAMQALREQGPNATVSYSVNKGSRWVTVPAKTEVRNGVLYLLGGIVCLGMAYFISEANDE
jgi:hypothetical protein